MTTTPHTPFTTAVTRLLSVPRLEGTFRVREGEMDVTDEFSEFRFRDPRLGGYLDRRRIEEHLLVDPLTLWLRGSWNRGDLLSGSPLPDAEVERNRWTVVVPPGAALRVTSPRRAFAVIKAGVGSIADGRPFVSRGQLAVGRTIRLTAAGTGLVARLDWLFETEELNLARATGTNLGGTERDWHRAPVAELLERIRGQAGH